MWLIKATRGVKTIFFCTPFHPFHVFSHSVGQIDKIHINLHSSVQWLRICAVHEANTALLDILVDT